MKKIITIEEAVSKIQNGMTLMIGGFLGAGSPHSIIAELVEKGVNDLTIICNDTAFADRGLGQLIANRQVKKVITSHIGTNTATIEQYNKKEIEVEFVPQGTLAERIRCGGAGLGGVLTPTGIGTIVEEGKQKITVNGKAYLLETALRADVALLGASVADKMGNLHHKGTTQNFNPIMATAADLVIAEADEIVEIGEIPMENIHTQGIFVDFIVKANK
ncbi:MAG: CoA transferase subunit A [Bacteroidales bacterium]|jgi:acetate CoA/acetoacetate CoA-transferase alpha subunit|nr:CoA transferase subunit A [Bacteroidales bacterium]HOL96878.1 CoA transferase subunit A [Bacteroidales bacterium]HOM36841.1 CoA transferase subunit A [Bacteroidales bacterium]HPD24312.1 CoA transferase subunit A [Bacteroidales bacterium]HRS98435.1 CoA transferase subunit A [Bacteroidales bacterium]